MRKKCVQAFKWQEGHRRRSQITTADNSLKKCFLSSNLNSNLFLRILIFSLLNSIHVFGRFTRGCLDKVESLVNGIVSALCTIAKNMMRVLWSSFFVGDPDIIKRP